MDKAREELRRAETARRNVFLSFAYEDINEVNLLRGQAQSERSDIEFNDWSVQEPFDSSRADYIRQKIGERIAQSSVTVVFVSSATHRSRWVDWEIRESLERGKKVVAVHVGKRAPRQLPAAVTENRIAVVPWSKLADALK
ncbi:TIR domain-containing protein [Anaeromyxobacter sp. Fw109-5]|uniref:TIR domain-containing protein n=1 Tax=Anaeromyxobacter sp. (strain Fw109-5) TaxID=404589 RepID=UPI00190FBF48|nr:TIR domain-containing protein [Anaeromyxobacter sp. Fw109-5]